MFFTYMSYKAKVVVWIIKSSLYIYLCICVSINLIYNLKLY